MPDNIRDAISENARGPRRAAVDGISGEQHPLRDQIEADQYLDQRDANSNPARGLRFTRLKPPEATS